MTPAQRALLAEAWTTDALHEHASIASSARFSLELMAAGAPADLVLLGDAKSTAHFSIGSGTKLAMEDAIALFECVKANADIPAALAAFSRRGRREDGL